MKTKKICGKTQEKIRKAYFAGKLDDLLNEMQAMGEVTTESTKELCAFLELLEAEKSQVRETIGKKFYLGTENINPPSVDELSTNVDPEVLKEWQKKVDADEGYIKKLMEAVVVATHKKTLRIDDLKDVILEITVRMPSLDQSRVYKDQLYRAELTKIIDKYKISRAEAEERAKLTKEYRDYKLAVLFKENLIEFIMAAKKKVGSNW